MNMIDQALAIAVRAHAGQVDRGGRPYILHPLRLMHRCQSDEEMIVALLHDTVEDGDISLKDFERLQKYHKALGLLKSQIND